MTTEDTTTEIAPETENQQTPPASPPPEAVQDQAKEEARLDAVLRNTEIPEAQAAPAEETPVEDGTPPAVPVEPPNVIARLWPNTAARWDSLNDAQRQALLADAADLALGDDEPNDPTNAGASAAAGQPGASPQGAQPAGQTPGSGPASLSSQVPEGLTDSEMDGYVESLGLDPASTAAKTIKKQAALHNWLREVGLLTIQTNEETRKDVAELLPLREQQQLENALVEFNKGHGNALADMPETELEQVGQAARVLRKTHPTLSYPDAIELALVRRPAAAKPAARPVIDPLRAKMGRAAAGAGLRGAGVQPGRRVPTTWDEIQERLNRRLGL